MAYRYSIDKLLSSLGRVGRYQFNQALLLALTNVSVAFNLLKFVFLAHSVEYHCVNNTIATDSANSSHVRYEQCTINTINETTNETSHQPCKQWSYTGDKYQSIVSEWDLVCDSQIIARLPQSLFIVGQGVGAVTFSILADKYGRMPFLLISQLLSGIAGLVIAFLPNITLFTVFMAFNGVCEQGMVLMSVIMTQEMFPRSRRLQMFTVYLMCWSFSCMLVTLVAFLLRHETWRTQQLVFAAMSLTVIVQIIFLKESLRWLITNNKEKRYLAIINKAATVNKVNVAEVPLPTDDVASQYVAESSTPEENADLDMVESSRKKEDADNDVVPSLRTDASEDVVTSTTTKKDLGRHVVLSLPAEEAERPIESSSARNVKPYKYNCLLLFKNRFLLKMSLVIWASWMVDSLTYFSLYLTTSILADNLYLNFFLNSLAEVPSGALYWYFGQRLGRRRYFICFHILAGIFLLISTTVKMTTSGQSGKAIFITVSVFGFLGKVSSNACFNGMYAYIAEVYPTNIRAIGLGAASAANRIGGAVAPYMSILAVVLPWAPGTLVGVACLLVSILNYFFMESEDREMPQTAEEVQSWDRSFTASHAMSMCIFSMCQ